MLSALFLEQQHQLRCSSLANFLFGISQFGQIVSSTEHKVLKVSYCGQSVSVVRHAASAIALKAYSSYTPRPVDSVGSVGGTCKSKIAEIVLIRNYLFFTSSPEQKGQLTLNFVGSIGVTCRSKIAKIVPKGNPKRPPWWPSWNSFFFYAFFPEPKGQLTRELVGSIGMTCRSKIAKIVPIGNTGWQPSWKICFSLLLLNRKASWLETW